MGIADAKVALIAVASRATLLLMAAASDWLLADYDTSAHLNERPCGLDQKPVVAAQSVLFADVWDSVYFERISRCGYEFEHYLAFFPGLPKIVSWLSHDAPTAVEAGILVTTISFSISAVLMYRIGRKILRDEEQAITAVLLLCLSPASVFLSLAYTEAVFQVLTFTGIYLLINLDAPLLAAIPFSATCVIRSNGIVNAGFLLYKCLQSLGHASAGRARWTQASSVCLRAAAGLSAMYVSLALVLQHGYMLFCRSEAWRDAPEPRPYCNPDGPSIYSFIQSQYWGVGFLKYYRSEQVPNFLLAFPTLLIGCAAVVTYVHRDLARALTLGRLGPGSLHIRASLLLERLLPSLAAQDSTDHASHSHRQKSRPTSSGFFADEVFVFVVQLAAMLLIAALFMHIQVVTRFVTTCLALYWYMAELVVARGLQGKLVLAYCTFWAWMGLVLFPNFYPWT